LKLYIGTGGWDYYKGSRDKLAAYARHYNFVEVNSTFYSNPDLKIVKAWRNRVPDNFEFSVKCNKIITHKNMLHSIPESIYQAEYTARICQLLRSRTVILQTPPSLNITSDRISSLNCLIEVFRERGITTVLDARSKIPNDVLKIVNNLGIVLSVDLTKEEPFNSGEMVYSRLFGQSGARLHGFSEKEYIMIEQRLTSSRPKVAYLAFHGIQMYSDALQFKKHLSLQAL